MQMIEQLEGFSAEPYPDPPGSGKFSIGFGHQILPGESFTAITIEQARALLAADTQKARNVITAYIDYPLSTAQRAALTSFVYNIGGEQFLAGTVPAKINRGDLKAAGATMKEYVHSGGAVSSALVSRRLIESAPFLA